MSGSWAMQIFGNLRFITLSMAFSATAASAYVHLIHRGQFLDALNADLVRVSSHSHVPGTSWYLPDEPYTHIGVPITLVEGSWIRREASGLHKAYLHYRMRSTSGALSLTGRCLLLFRERVSPSVLTIHYEIHTCDHRRFFPKRRGPRRLPLTGSWWGDYLGGIAGSRVVASGILDFETDS